MNLKEPTVHTSIDGQTETRQSIYAKTLDELRDKEEKIAKDTADGIKVEARYTTINELYDLWITMKRGVKNNTLENYKYMYETFVRGSIGKKRICNIKKSDVKNTTITL